MCCHLCSYFKHTLFTYRYIGYAWTLLASMVSLISTRPLRPSGPWLQEVVPSVRCLQRVFVRAKLKAAYVSASLPQPGGDVEHPISLCANMTSSTKPEIRNVSLRRQRWTEPRPYVTGTKKFVKIGRVVLETWSRTDKPTHTQTHTDRQTRSSQYSTLPYRGGGVITEVHFANTQRGAQLSK